MKRPVYRLLGICSVILGVIGAFLPLLPTTPFLILAAYFFAHSHPEWEAWLLAHPRLGPAIVAWRQRRAIPRAAKLMAGCLLAISAIGAWLWLTPPLAYVPGGVGMLVLGWMLTRPNA